MTVPGRDRTYRLAIRLFGAVFRVMGYRFDVRGAQHIPDSGAAVIAGNHIGFLDFTFIGYAARDRKRLIRFMTKSQVFDIPVVGRLVRAMHHVPVDRRSGARAYRQGLRLLDAGELVGVFPEATISRSWLLKPFKRGAAGLAVNRRVPLVPVVVWGGHRVFTVDGHRSLRRRIPVTIIVGEPLLAKVGETVDELSTRLHDVMEALLAEAIDSLPRTSTRRRRSLVAAARPGRFGTRSADGRCPRPGGRCPPRGYIRMRAVHTSTEDHHGFESSQPVTVGDLTFDVRTAGPEDGAPVILLHGFPQTSLSWSSVAHRLTNAGLRVIAPDQRGYSPRARPEDVDAYRTELLAQDVIDIADSMGLDTFHLVGHDWGAAVAWLVAGTHPDRVSTLTAVSVPHLTAYNAALRDDADQQQRASYIQLFREPGKAEDLLLADAARRLTAMYGDAVPIGMVVRYVAHFADEGALTAALNWYRAMGPALADTPRTQVPTTYVWGELDQAIGRAGAEACGGFVDADYRFVVLEDIGHWIPEQAPQALADAIIARVG
ncbi:alpha/beta fold hydrolase [Aeromicrobium sp. UC242_57]|uniref:alpha/beta fold hydrolase n=1 Tax=Aeromicrobium sp. UC242_57 TaxID=3374624 RepID=UPI0037B8179E